ncbi:hypothetical protein T01_8465 [Trichinella spiralis]|uniref:Uncharacterized protein n=1 Tax=Trichinella spiralis TaxID=6334 RepID=A0A0V1BCC4_TRISP|nr:hypothetical protein T01_8465 [Trichinella spiralis]
MWKNKKANSVQFCQLYDPFKQQLRNILIKAQPRDKLESWLIARIIADKVNSFKCNVSKYESVNEARCVPSPDKHCQRTVPYSSFSTSESNCSESLCVSLVSHNRTLKAVHSSAVLAYQKLQLSKRGNCNSNCTKRRTEDYRSDRTSDLLGTVREGLENRKSAAGGGELSYVSSIWAVSASSADASTVLVQPFPKIKQNFNYSCPTEDASTCQARQRKRAGGRARRELRHLFLVRLLLKKRHTEKLTDEA